MKYNDGQDAKLGDQVKLGDDIGVVVFSIDSDEYSSEYPRESWQHLKKGIMVKFPKFGLIHYEVAEPDLELLARG